MLARNAESLYWIGRYVERADDTARILDVSVHQLLEDATVDADLAARTLLAVLGRGGPARRDPGRLVADRAGRLLPEQAGSIVSSVSSARENARGAREVVSSEMWECLNATWNALPERQRYARWVGPHAFFSYVEDRAAMFSGLAASTMSRDDSWRFYLLGRSVERVDMIVRLLLSRVSDRMSSPGLAHRAAQRRRRRHLPAHLPGRAGRVPGGAVPADGQAVPALGVPRAAPGRDVPGAIWTTGRAPGSGPRPRRCGCSAGPARSWSSCAPRSCSTICRPSCSGLQECIRDVGEAVSLQYFHAAPWVAWTAPEVS